MVMKHLILLLTMTDSLWAVNDSLARAPTTLMTAYSVFIAFLL